MKINKNDYRTNIRKIYDFEKGGWLIPFINVLFDKESILCKRLYFANYLYDDVKDNEFYFDADGIIYRLRINKVDVALGSEVDEIEDKCFLAIYFELCKRDFANGKSIYKNINNAIGGIKIYVDDLM